MPTAPCDNFPDWQGCECEKDAGHTGPHKCVCGALWDDDGRRLRAGYQPPDIVEMSFVKDLDDA